jgi:hypothetical protein
MLDHDRTKRAWEEEKAFCTQLLRSVSPRDVQLQPSHRRLPGCDHRESQIRSVRCASIDLIEGPTCPCPRKGLELEP